jgi:hypothetical protein
MKDFFAAFGSEVFRPLVTLLIPGSLAVLPYILYLIDRYRSIAAFVEHNPITSVCTLIAAALFIGMILEDLGTHIEDGWDSRLGEPHYSDWVKYLRLAFKTEPVGHRYLRNLVLRLKFELSAYISLLIAIPGIFAVADSILGFVRTTVTCTMISLLASWLRHEAYCTHVVLSHLRSQLLQGIFEVPGTTDFTSCPVIPAPQDAREGKTSRITIAATVFAFVALLALVINVFGITYAGIEHFVLYAPIGRYTFLPSRVFGVFAGMSASVLGWWGYTQTKRSKKLAHIIVWCGCIVACFTLIPWEWIR